MKISSLTMRCNNSRPKKWEYLLKNGFAQFWFPDFVDIILDQQSSDTIGEFISSEEFLCVAKKHLHKAPLFHANRNIDIDSLSLEEILNKINLGIFVERMACRFKERNFGLYSYFESKLCHSHEDLCSIFLNHISRRIVKFDPKRKSSLGAYLANISYFDVLNEIKKECRQHSVTTTLNQPCKENEDFSLLDIIPAEDTGVSDMDVSLDLLDDDRLLKVFADALDNPKIWNLFFKAVYKDKTLEQIAHEEGVTKSAISQRLDAILNKIRNALQALGITHLEKGKTDFRTLAGVFSEYIQEDIFLEKVRCPSERIRCLPSIILDRCDGIEPSF